jgi:glc operon protein GlcG
VGAIGVSGMTADQDAAVARAGVEAFELKAQDCSS